MVSVVLTSGFLQTLVKCSNLVGPKLYTPLAEKLVSVLEAKNTGSKMDGPCWRLVEAILVAKDPAINQSVFEKFFKGDLKNMARDPENNFSVQRLLENCPSKEQV